MGTVDIKTAGSTRKLRLNVPERATYADFRRLVADATGLPEPRLSLIVRGKPLQPSSDAALPVTLAPNDTVLAIVKPDKPPDHVVNRDGADVEDEDDDDLTVDFSSASSSMQHRIGGFLRDKLKCPDLVLVVFFWFSLRTWALIILWFSMAPVVQHYFELGPLYIIGTCFALIFFNLGTRREGEASAYSIFNEGFQELPGTLNANRLDEDIRAGRF